LLVSVSFNAKILKIWLVYIFDVYHQHGQDKITSTKHVLAGQLDYRGCGNNHCVSQRLGFDAVGTSMQGSNSQLPNHDVGALPLSQSFGYGIVCLFQRLVTSYANMRSEKNEILICQRRKTVFSFPYSNDLYFQIQQTSDQQRFLKLRKEFHM
jgi:hypothetical protein